MINKIYISIPNTYPALCIECDNDGLLFYLYNNMRPYAFLQNEMICQRNQVNIRIEKLQRGYNISFDEKKRYAKDDDHLLRIIGVFVNGMLATENSYIAIHCAVLANEHNNYLFVGASGTGKSTLAAFLSERGFLYYTDDKALINCLSGSINPFEKPIYLRPDGKRVLEETLGVSFDVERVSFGKEIRYSVNRQHNEMNYKKVKIIFLVRNSNNKKSICRLLDIDALKEIIFHMIYVKNMSLNLKSIIHLLPQVECYRLEYDTLFDVEELLQLI